MKYRRLVAAVGMLGIAATLLTATTSAFADEVVYSADFEDGTTQGWFGRGSAAVAVSTDQANGGSASLLTTGRTAEWNGPGLDARSIMQAGETYQIEATVRLAAGSTANVVHMTVARTPTGGDAAFDRVVGDVAVDDAGWATVSGSYTFTTADNSQLELYLESPDPALSFYLDDVTITQIGGGSGATVLSTDFEDGTTQGWFGRGGAAVAVSTDQAHSGTSSLLTTGRSDSWHGPAYNLLGVLQPGVPYTISAFARLNTTEPATDVLHMTVARTPTGGDAAFDRVVGDVSVSSDGWVELTGAYTFDTADNSQLELYLESPNTTLSFYLDDVTITGPEGPAEEGVVSDFETGTNEGWGPRGPETVAVTDVDAHGGTYSLLTSGRTEAWNGPALPLLGVMTPGRIYDFSLWLKLAPGQEPADLRVSIQRDFTDGTQSFTTIAGNQEVTADQWVNFTASYTLTGDVTAVSVYAESASALVDFYMDDFSMLLRETPPVQQDIPSLKDVLADHFPIGAAIDERETTGAPAELLTKHFNSVTAENAMKWEEIEPVEGEFDFSVADAVVNHAEANGMRVYGHTLVWHSQVPAWVFQDAAGEPLTNSPEDQALLLSRIENHINGIAARYGDRIWAWDAVNEAIDESQADGLRRSPFYNILGPGYIAEVFRIADAAFPNANLYLNDYNTEFPAKREAMFSLVSQLLADGVPIDGVGHQLHVSLNRPVSLVDDTIQRFRALPVSQVVTELDVSISESSQESLPTTPPDRLIRLGYYYRDMFDVLRSHSDVIDTVTMWGLYDARSWLKGFPIDRPHEAPLLFDDDLQAKLAYWGIVDPSRLPHLAQELNVAAGTPVVDGERELQWDRLPQRVLRAGEEGAPGTGFQARWDDGNLYVLVEVADATAGAGDRVDLFVDDANAKAGAYGPGDAHYTVERDGTVTGGIPAEVAATGAGYRVEAALPLATPGALGRDVGFDVRVTDGDTGDVISWSDQDHGQDTDTSRWGTLSLIEAIGTIEVPQAPAAPAIDGTIDAAWADAAVARTDVLVEGSADGAKGDFRLLWDDTNLYVLAEVTDPQLDAGSSNPWEQDSIEVFVDPGNTKSGGFKSVDGQYRVNFQNAQSISGDVSVIGDNLTSATASTDTGYLVELAITLEGMTPAEGAFIGLELQVNDGTAGVRTAVHAFSDPTGQSFQNTTRWGVGQLVGPVEPPPPPPPSCDRTIDGFRLGSVTVNSGDTTCIEDGALILGSVTVKSGGSLVVTGGTILGKLTTTGADTVQLSDAQLLSAVSIKGSTGSVTVSGLRMAGTVSLTNNSTGDTPIVVSGNEILGLLSCSGNEPPPVNNGDRNTVLGLKLGQCRGL